MIKQLFSLLLICISTTTIAQMKIEYETSSGEEDIKDGSITIKVTGGQAPYKYVWSENGVSLYQTTATGLAEGKEYTVTVYDANGEKVEETIELKAESLQEKINASAKPTVDFVGGGVFWDPFEAIGLYDPTIYVDEESFGSPFDGDDNYKLIVLEEWLTKEGKQGEPVALLRTDGAPLYVYSPGNGKIESDLKEGDTLKYVNADGKALISGVNIGTIKYDEPQAAKAANGSDKKSNPIPLVVVWLVFGAIFFTIYMRFVNFRGAKHAIELVQGKFDNPNHKEAGEVSHFQALTTALSGTVGLGNIASVAIAIAAGGPGATFWMILAGLLGMSSKFVECTLGVKYREIDADDGEVHGGPMYYLSKGLAKRNMKGLGKVLAAIFAILCIGGSFGGGNMFQANQAFAQFKEVAGFDNGVVFGFILAALVGVVIIGGIKKIAKVTDKIVPLMVGVYVLFALIIIFMNIGNIGTAFGAIFDGAFNADALKGGILGVLIIGFQRAAFSNEAGVGSASIAHSAAKTDEPVSEGIVALLEPFIDTVVVCTMTALVLIFTGYAEDTQGLSGANLTSAAFSEQFVWFKYVLTIAIMLFAFSTMISWSYYGLKAWTYLFGRTKAMDVTYKAIFLVFVVVGASISLGAVLDFSDMMVLGMAFPNILGMILLAPEVKADMKDYFARIKSGAIKKYK